MEESKHNLLVKVLTLLFIGVLFAFFVAHRRNDANKSVETYKVLRVIEGDKFVIDINKNGIEDKDEIFHLNFVNSFPIKYSSKTSVYAKKFGFSISEIITLGYGAREFSVAELEGKAVALPEGLEEPGDFNPEYGYRFALLELNGVDYSKTLLQNGFGFSYNPQNYDYYKKFENIERVKLNLKTLLLLDIMNVDTDNNTYHELDCPEILKIKNSKLMPLAEILSVLKEFKKCEHCYVKRDFEKELERQILKIESPNPDLKVGAFELYLINPNNYLAPTHRCRTNACQALIKNINSVKDEIAFAVYGFSSQDEIFEALKAAKNRGVKVVGVVDIKSKGEYEYSDTEKYVKEFLLVPDHASAIMHNKFFIFDNSTVFSATMNISSTGSGGYNSNTAVIIHSPFVANLYRMELEQMLSGKFHKKKKVLECVNSVSPALPAQRSPFDLPGGIKVSVYFSPKDDIYLNALKPLIDNAKNEILISAFYLTHKDFVQDLINAKARGVKIKVIVDAVSATNKYSAHNTLRSAKIPTKVENWGGKNHEKNIVVDSKFFVIGSANFSKSAVSSNDENLILVENTLVAQKYREHFLKLYSSIDDKYLTATPRAEGFESKNSCFDGIDNDFDGKIDSKDEGCKRRILR